VDAFSSINNSHRITPEFNFDATSHPLLSRFDQFYEQLSLILTCDSSPNQGRKKPPLNPSSRTQIVLPSSTVAPTTPPQSTNAINPQYSSGSSASASSQAEEKDEHYTQSFATEFVYESYKLLLKWLQPIAWYRETKYKLRHPYAAWYYLVNCSAHQKMHVRLQGNKVTAESDGGISFQPDPSLPCMFPVFSIEVSRLSH
jgi:hypothetical protein